MNKILNTLVIFFILCSVCSAKDKPDITASKLLTKTEQAEVKAYLKGKEYFMKAIPAKNDYKNVFNKGTVVYDEKRNNYSFQIIDVQDSTTFEGKNFSQVKPNTSAIKGKNHTFIDCNLTNVKIDSSWTLINCNARQQKRKIKSSSVDKNVRTTITEISIYRNGKWAVIGTDILEAHTSDGGYAELQLREQEQGE